MERYSIPVMKKLISYKVCVAFLAILLAGEKSAAFLLNTRRTKSSNSYLTLDATRYEVCMSPGCMADGASSTLQKLQALVPPGDEVVEGVCCSLCGNGPIVMTPTEKMITKHRRTKGAKLLEILSQDKQAKLSQQLVEAYALYEQGIEAMEVNDLETAVNPFKDAIRIGSGRPSVDLQEQRQKYGIENLSVDGIPTGLLWLIDLQRKSAYAQIELKNLEGALIAAVAANNLAAGNDTESLEILVRIHEMGANPNEELAALRNLIQLMDSKGELSRQDQNKRRQMGFRQQNLERLTV